MKQLSCLLGLMFVFGLQPAFADDTAPPPAKAPPPAAAPASKTAAKPAAAPAPRVQVVTNMGNFVIELNSERAPLTVANFLKNVDAGHYSNTIFHRVIPNFIVQAGGFDTTFQAKQADRVVNESGNGLSNIRTTVGMARNNEPHGSDAQFYVNLFDNAALDPSATHWGYAVFGKVVQGMEVVDQIGNVPTGSRGPFKEDTPLKSVVIQKIERVPNP
jgi:cyclophilin family peptidyl-prolyl cis-trans isomerase